MMAATLANSQFKIFWMLELLNTDDGGGVGGFTIYTILDVSNRADKRPTFLTSVL